MNYPRINLHQCPPSNVITSHILRPVGYTPGAIWYELSLNVTMPVSIMNVITDDILRLADYAIETTWYEPPSNITSPVSIPMGVFVAHSQRPVD